MSDFSTGIQYLSRNDPILAAVAAQHPLQAVQPHTNYYEELVSSIISQQLSVKAAATIEGRVKALFGDRYPTPAEILATPTEVLRGAGLSGQKSRYITDLAAKTESGEIRFDHLDALDNAAVIAELIQVKGIGEWTAHMFLMFCMARLDVLPIGDLGIRAGIQKLYGLAEVPTPQAVTEFAQSRGWHPYESIAARLIWKSLDNEPSLV